MIESRLLHGDQMVLEVEVWEELSVSERFEWLQKKEGYYLTLTFRVLLRGANLVVVTAQPHHPAKCQYAESRRSQSSYQEGTAGNTAFIIGRMILEYRLTPEDRIQVFDEIQAFLDDHMPVSIRLTNNPS